MIQGTFKKLFIGRGQRFEEEKYSTIARRWENLRAIWNNTFQEDAGF